MELPIDRAVRADMESPVATMAPPIEHNFDRLGVTINYLDDRIDNLTNRIRPILGPGAPDSDKTKDPSPAREQCDIAQMLQDLTERLDTMTQHIVATIDRIEL